MSIDTVRGQVRHLVLSATGWDERPRRLSVGGRTISVEFSGSQPATLLTAVCVSSRVDLLVIPPASGRRTAQAAMIQASSTGNRVIVPRTEATGASHAAWDAARKAA